MPKKTKNNSQYTSNAPTLVHRIEERTDIDVCVQLLLPLLPKFSALLLVSLPTGFLTLNIAEKGRKATAAFEQVITRRPASEAGGRGRVNCLRCCDLLLLSAESGVDDAVETGVSDEDEAEAEVAFVAIV